MRLKAPVAASRREAENEEAIGGMRNPHRAMARMPRTQAFGQMVAELLDKAIELWPELEVPAKAILSGEPASELPDGLVASVRKSFLRMTDGERGRPRTARAETPIQSQVLSSWGRHTEDPDAEVLAGWLDHGAPLGFTQEVTSTGIFPKVEGLEWDEEQFRALERSLEGWSNYQSAVDEAEDLKALIGDYQDRGFCHLVYSMREAEEELGRPPILNRLGVVVKWKGEKKKSRIIWDLRESRANEACSQSERIILPRLNDLGLAASRAYRHGRVPWIAGIDIKDAFMNIPAGPDKFMTVSVVPGEGDSQKLVIFDTWCSDRPPHPRYGAGTPHG